MITNHFREFRDSIRQAESDIRSVEALADDMAQMLVGRLRMARQYWLKKLKHELRDFNICTGKWKGGNK